MALGILKKMRKQWAVYWATESNDQFGNPVYEEPVEIKCRWEDKQDLFRDKEGKEVVSSAKVWPDRHLTLDGVLWEGRLEDVPSQTHPFENPGSRAIRSTNSVPSLNAKQFARWVYL